MADGTASVAGLGDEATYAMYFLHVRKGNAMLDISVNLPNRMMALMREGQGGPQKYAAVVFDMDKTVAAKALARL